MRWLKLKIIEEADEFISKEMGKLLPEIVHSLPITPKMRESVMKKGVPLFGAGGLAATAGMQDSNGL